MSFALQVDAHLATLVSEQCAQLLGSLDMSALYRMTEEFSTTPGGFGGPASALPGCDSIAAQMFAHKLEEFLDKPDLMTIPQVRIMPCRSPKKCYSTLFEQVYTLKGPTNLFMAAERESLW